MPQWKKVPTLKTLSLRKVAWPDAVHKPAHAKKHFPTVETYVRHTLISRFLEKTKAAIKKKKKHNINTESEPIRQVTEEVVNAWIRLSNFYETRLNELGSLSMFLRVSTIGTLDFLHEGFTLRNEKNFLHKILPYIGVVPYTLKPQKIDFRTWFDLVNIMVKEGISETVNHLYIPFGNEKILKERRKSLDDPRSHHMASPLVYRFEETLECFMNLRTIVVRGEVIRDTFMYAVGENCVFLEYLDVRGTRVSDRGVALLLFRKLGKRFFKGSFLPTGCRFPFYPAEIKRPCCSTLKYLDISETLTGQYAAAALANEHHHMYDLYILRACPQLRATPLKFYFHIPGRSRVVLKDLITEGHTLVNFRQELVHYVRQLHSERLFEFVQVLFGCINFEEPSLEVMENQFGEETAFLFLSGSAIILHCEIENLTVITLVSYARNVLNFIPISLISKFAPKLQKLKCSLKGELSEATEMKSLKYLSSPFVKSIETLISIVAFCPELEYLEVKEIFSIDTSKQFGLDAVEKIFSKGPGEYENLEVLRFLFPNQIVLYPGLSWIAVRCPALRIVGDLAVWGIPYDTVMRIYANTSLYNYEFAIEHQGILHFCDIRNKMDLARFE